MNVSSLSEAANAPTTAGKPYREREIWYISLIFETLSAHCCCWAVRIIITSRSIVICYRSLPVEHEYNRPPLFSCLFIPLFFPPFSFFNTRRQTGSFAIAIVSDGGYWKKGKKRFGFYRGILLIPTFESSLFLLLLLLLLLLLEASRGRLEHAFFNFEVQ